mmetsp:Transcript_151890/g.279394  ORF Transcript_151890/g.279394 Transcript_151890/m.279394 type:complete len:205 (+) Transcript_151890:625-1239(+)
MRESISTSSSEAPSTFLYIVGKAILIDAKIWQDMFAAAPAGLKDASECFTPAAKIAIPRTRSKLDRMDPRRLPCTTRMRPARTACTHMIISTALPKVAFNKPPISWPVCAARTSVDAPRMLARGTMARKLKANIQALLNPNCFDASPKGTNMSKRFNHWQKIVFSPRQSFSHLESLECPFWPSGTRASGAGTSASDPVLLTRIP